MPEESEQLAVSIVGDGQSAEKMLATVAEGLNRFVQAANKALGAWAKFTDVVESRASVALSKVNSGVEAVTVALLKTDAALAPAIHGINDFTASLNGGATASKDFAAAAEKVGAAAKESAEGTDKSGDSIGRLNLLFRAGKLDFADYIDGLKDVADASESSAETQLRAIAAVRAAEKAAEAESKRKGAERTRAAVAQTRDQSTVGNAFSSAGSTLTNSITRPLMMGGQDAIAAAGALETSQERVKAVFGESASAVKKWGKTASDAFAMSTREALSNAAALGTSLTEMGLGKDKAAEYSEDIVELSSKFAALKGVEPEVALRAFTAAMTGRGTAALRQFGVDLSANTIKVEAAKEGMVSYSVNQEKVSVATDAVARATEKASEAVAKHGQNSVQALAAHDALVQAQARLQKATAGTAAALTTAQKAQVVHTLLMRHATDASKGYAAVANTQEVIQRRLTSTTEDTAAAYGKAMIPVLESGERLLIRVYTALEHLSPAGKNAVLIVAGLAAAMGPLASGIGFVINGLILWDRTSAFMRNSFPGALDEIATKLGIVKTGTEAAAVADGELATAAEGAAVAEEGTAAAGLLAFGPAAPLVLAIVAFTALIAGLAIKWGEVKEAQDQAAESARNFASAEAEASAKGKHHSLQVQSSDLAQKVSEKQTEIDEARQPDAFGVSASADEISKKQRELADLKTQQARVDAQLKATPLDPVHRPAGTPGTPGAGGAKGSGGNDAAAEEKRYRDAMAKAKAEAEALTSGANKKGGGGAYRPDMPMPAMGDLEPLESLIGANPMAKDTNAENYAVQMQTLKDRFAQEEMKRLKAASSGGGNFDRDAFKRQELGYNLNLSSNAEAATKSEIAKLLPITEAAAEKVKALRGQLNTLRSEMSGSKATDGQKRQYAALTSEYGTARKGYDADFKALELNRRVNSEAIGHKSEIVQQLSQMNAEALAKSRSAWLEQQKVALAQGLEQPGSKGGQNRDEYDNQLKAAIERITHESGGDAPELKAFRAALAESVKAREAANREVQTAIARLTKGDFDLKQQEIDAEAGRRRANGEDGGAVDAWQAAATGQNSRARFTSDFAAQDEQNKANVQDGSESLAQYQQFLTTMRDAAKAAFGEADLIVAKLNYDLAQGGLAIVAHDAEQAKEAYDAGGVSMEQYRARLVQLRAGLSESSAAYKELTGSIHSLDMSALTQQAQAAKEAYESGAISVDAYRQRLQALRSEVAQGSAEYKQFTGSMLGLDRAMVDKARQAATQVGSSFADMAMQVAQNVSGAGATLRNFLHSVGEDAIKRNLAAWASKVVRGGQSASDPHLSAAQREIDAAQKQAAQAQKDAGAGLTKAASDLTDAAQALQDGSDGAGDYAEGEDGSSAGAAGKIGAGVGVAGDLTKAVKGGGLGDAAGAVESAAKSGWLGKALGAAVPIVGTALAAGSFLSDIFGGSHKIDYTSHAGEALASAMGRGDHSGMFDSGFTGSASLRGLLSQNNAKAAAKAPQVTHGDTHITIHVHPSPGMNEAAVGAAVARAVGDAQEQQTRRDAMRDALTPTNTHW